jgi:hypothetical protein
MGGDWGAIMGMTRRARTWPLCAVLLVVGLLVGTSAAHAAASSVQIPAGQRASTVLTPGAKVVLEADVIPKDWCRVGLSHTGADPARSAAHFASGGLAEFSWRVPKSVAAGKWRTTVRCAPSRLGLLRGRGKAATVTLRTSRQGREHHGTAAGAISVTYLHASFFPAPSTGKGGGAYPPYGALLIAGSAWLDGQGVNVYSNGSDGNEQGIYQCVELVNRLITTRGWSPSIYGNANQLYGNASTTYFNKYGNGTGYHPVPGDIVVWGGGAGGFGHVAVVDANSGGLLTVVEENASPSGYGTYPISSSGYIAPTAYGYYVEGFLHPKADHIPATGGGGSGGSGSGETGPGGGGTGPGNEPTGLDDVYFVGTDGRIHLWLYSGTGWTEQNLGGSVATGTSPSAFESASGAQYVYFVGTDGRIHVWLYSGGSGWTEQNLGGSVATGTSPSAFESASGAQYVYFVGTDGRIHVWLYSGGSGWTEQNLGGSVATGTSPSAFEDSSGDQYVYFVGTDGRIHVWLYSGGTGWTEQNLGGSVAGGASPNAFENASGDQYVYFVGTDGRIHVWLYSGGSGWTEQNLGGSVASGASPSAFENSSGAQYVYFVGSDGRIHVWLYSGGTGWTEQNLGGSVAGATSPSAYEDASGDQYVYFVGTDSRIHVWLYSGGTGWQEQNLGGSVAGGASPSGF